MEEILAGEKFEIHPDCSYMPRKKTNRALSNFGVPEKLILVRNLGPRQIFLQLRSFWQSWIVSLCNCVASFRVDSGFSLCTGFFQLGDFYYTHQLRKRERQKIYTYLTIFCGILTLAIVTAIRAKYALIYRSAPHRQSTLQSPTVFRVVYLNLHLWQVYKRQNCL